MKTISKKTMIRFLSILVASLTFSSCQDLFLKDDEMIFYPRAPIENDSEDS